MKRLVAVAGAFLASAAPAGARPHFIEARLISETLSPKPGANVLVGVQMTPRPGWHGYWSNPGESGLAPVVQWTAPPGVRFGPLQHPAPSLMRVMGVSSYVHAGPHVLITHVSVAPLMPRGFSLPISAEVVWAACSDRLCVPEHATLSLQMTVGEGAPSADAPLLRRSAASEPRDGGEGKFDVSGTKLVLQLPVRAKVDARHARFFPDENGFFEPTEAQARPGSPLRIEAPAKGSLPKRITGVVSDGSAAYRVRLFRGHLWSGRQAAARATPKPAAAPRPSRPAPSAQVTIRSAASNPPASRRTFGVWALIGTAVLVGSGAISLILLGRRTRAERGS